MANPKDSLIKGPNIHIEGNPLYSYNPSFENHLVDDQTIVNSSGYIAQVFNNIEYRQYVHKNASDQIVRIDPWKEYGPVE